MTSDSKFPKTFHAVKFSLCQNVELYHTEKTLNTFLSSAVTIHAYQIYCDITACLMHYTSSNRVFFSLTEFGAVPALESSQHHCPQKAFQPNKASLPTW